MAGLLKNSQLPESTFGVLVYGQYDHLDVMVGDNTLPPSKALRCKAGARILIRKIFAAVQGGYP